MATTSQHSTARLPPLRMWAPGTISWDAPWAVADRVHWDRLDREDLRPLPRPVPAPARPEERPSVKATITISPHPFREPNVNIIITSYHRPNLRRKPDISANTPKVSADTMPTLISKERSETNRLFISRNVSHHPHFVCFLKKGNLHLDDLQFSDPSFT